MSAPLNLSRARIEQQASLWAARLETGALSDDEQQELSRWLAAEPEHQWVLSRYREMCAQLAEQVPVLLEPELVESVVAAASARHRWRRAATPFLAIAAALTIAGLVWWISPQRVETHAFERRTLTLADGSRVELNAQTALSIELGRHERHVKFVHGEALFQVAHDASHPFFVDTPRGTIRVTGTSFNVRETASANVEVTVLEGNVQVRAADASLGVPTALAIGDQAALGTGKVDVNSLSSDETQNVVAWRVGQAAFQRAPLVEALAHFAPYHAGTITVSPAVAGCNVGGRYSLDDLDGFLSAIEQALPVSVLRSSNGNLQVVPRPRR